MEVIQKQIQEAIAAQGVSQADLAREWGVSRQAVHQTLYLPWVRPPMRLMQLGNLLGLREQCLQALEDYKVSRAKRPSASPDVRAHIQVLLQPLVEELNQRMNAKRGTRSRIARELGWALSQTYLKQPTFLQVVSIAQCFGMTVHLEMC